MKILFIILGLTCGQASAQEGSASEGSDVSKTCYYHYESGEYIYGGDSRLVRNGLADGTIKEAICPIVDEPVTNMDHGIGPVTDENGTVVE